MPDGIPACAHGSRALARYSPVLGLLPVKGVLTGMGSVLMTIDNAQPAQLRIDAPDVQALLPKAAATGHVLLEESLPPHVRKIHDAIKTGMAMPQERVARPLGWPLQSLRP